MRRALRGAVGVVLSIGAMLPARSALAQSPAQPLWYQSSPIRKVQYEGTVVLQEGHSRLEEMKVELGLLADISTFPYYLGARAAGETLSLRGYVPNEMVRQRALEIASRSTFLTVRDELKAQKNLSLRPSLRPPETLQEEGIEMLRKKLGEPARQMTLTARPNGIVVLRGRIDSVESKVEISRLFRQLSGCFGIINELIVEQVLHDGQRLIQVTRDGSTFVPPSALGQEAETIHSSPPLPPTVRPAPLSETPRPTRLPFTESSSTIESKPTVLPPPRPTLPPPTPLSNRSLDVQDGERRLPNPSKPATGQPQVAPQKKGTNLDALTSPRLPTRWGQPKKPETAPTTAKPTGSPEKLPTVLSSPIRWVDTKKPNPSTEVKKPNRASNTAHTGFAQSHAAPTTDMSWHPPKGSEESEPKTPVATQKPETPSRTPTASSPSTTSVRRWPPAYEAHSSENNGRPGVISFDDDPPPQPKPALAPRGTSPPVVPANLQRQVKSACGRQARDVLVEVQRDGTVFVKVKVPNQSVEDQLTRKILAIPEMTSPKVRLMMDVGP